jgi:hypothetical protein
VVVERRRVIEAMLDVRNHNGYLIHELATTCAKAARRGRFRGTPKFYEIYVRIKIYHIFLFRVVYPL